MTGNENSILVKIAEDIGEMKTDVAVVKTEFGYLKANQTDMLEKINRNTDQISEVRRKIHHRHTLFDVGKIWPFIVGIVVAAAAGGFAWGDKLFK